jgi:hypothetical protein
MKLDDGAGVDFAGSGFDDGKVIANSSRNFFPVVTQSRRLA